MPNSRISSTIANKAIDYLARLFLKIVQGKRVSDRKSVGRFLDGFDLAIIIVHPVWVVLGRDCVCQNQRYQCIRHSEKHCQMVWTTAAALE